eukprot:7000863-Pyramimonas_sp.AAC.1
MVSPHHIPRCLKSPSCPPRATMSLYTSLDELCQEERGPAPATMAPFVRPGGLGSLSGLFSASPLL